ncbi:hypothetical protein NXF25_019132 [Crotalus adamanteus]|uniref:Uncharacterized protein n=1 Tax=Crotalus adamanteus TaxID=8729 RepID=A0AAW1B1X1_CROAD
MYYCEVKYHSEHQQ